MTGGRIYHQNLLIEIAGLQFRTYGSVGLDDSLKIMIETSVPLHWLPANAVTDAIRKQKIQVPMSGTLNAPHLDAGELARVMAQVGGNVARGLLDSNLGDQLRGLRGRDNSGSPRLAVVRAMVRCRSRPRRWSCGGSRRADLGHDRRPLDRVEHLTGIGLTVLAHGRRLGRRPLGFLLRGRADAHGRFERQRFQTG